MNIVWSPAGPSGAGPHDVPLGLKIAGRAAWSAVAVAALVQLA